MLPSTKDSHLVYFLLAVVFILLYVCYDKHLRNQKMLKICADQDVVIHSLTQAITMQKLYIAQLEYYYNVKKNDPPIHH